MEDGVSKIKEIGTVNKYDNEIFEKNDETTDDREVIHPEKNIPQGLHTDKDGITRI